MKTVLKKSSGFFFLVRESKRYKNKKECKSLFFVFPPLSYLSFPVLFSSGGVILKPFGVVKSKYIWLFMVQNDPKWSGNPQWVWHQMVFNYRR